MNDLTALWLRLWTTTPNDPLPPGDQDPDKVRQAACQLVATDQVCKPPKPPTPPNVNFNLDWLGTVLWTLLIGGLLVVLYFLVRWLISMDGARGKRSKQRKLDGPSTEDLDDLGPVAIDRSREPLDWRAEAEAHRRAGRIRDALRCRYRALVGDLARRGLIDEIPGRTTGEERSQLRHVAPNAAPPFADAADLFDDAWYGNAAVGEADDDAFQRFEHTVLQSTSDGGR
jgi:Domain of unknown function (DUF4129)